MTTIDIFGWLVYNCGIMKNILKNLIISIIIASALLLTNSAALAGKVSGYYKKNGTYVQSYYRSSPNAYKYDNYNYRGGNRYNNSYYYPTRNYSSDWYTPNYYYRYSSYYW